MLHYISHWVIMKGQFKEGVKSCVMLSMVVPNALVKQYMYLMVHMGLFCITEAREQVAWNVTVQFLSYEFWYFPYCYTCIWFHQAQNRAGVMGEIETATKEERSGILYIYSAYSGISHLCLLYKEPAPTYTCTCKSIFICILLPNRWYRCKMQEYQ